MGSDPREVFKKGTNLERTWRGGEEGMPGRPERASACNCMQRCVAPYILDVAVPYLLASRGQTGPFACPSSY